MLRKSIRLRREYLFTMENQKQLKQKYERKRNIPTQIYKEAQQLKKQIEAQDDNTIIPRNHIDDQYQTNNYQDPTLLITTSRNPSTRLIQFVKVFHFHQQLNLVLPNSIRINRGSYVVNQLAKLARIKYISDLIVVHEHRGQPDGMIISHFPVGPTIYFSLQNVILRHDVKEKLDKISQARPNLIFNGFSTKLGQRIVNIMKHLFPIPKIDTKRIITFSNQKDVIQFRHHQFQKINHKTVQLNELGPKFQLKPYQIMLGTIQQSQATKQWVLRSYINTASKRNLL